MTLSLTSIKRLTALALVLIILGILMDKSCQYGKRTVKNIPVEVLPQDVKERIIVNPKSHTLTVVKPSGEEKLFLPDHNSVIEIKDNGTVNVSSSQWGINVSPFVGVVESNNAIVIGGIDLFYYKRLDLGLGVGYDFQQIRGLGTVSYTIYDNLRMTAGYDTSQHFSLGLTVRI